MFPPPGVAKRSWSVHSLVAYARQSDGLRAVAGIIGEP